MTMRSAFFDSVAGDRSYGSQDFANLFASFQPDGPLPDHANGLLVAPSNPAAMSVQVSTGAAFIQGRLFEVYSAPETLAIAAAHATLARIDLVVLRLDYTNRTITLAVKTGTAAASPTAPALTQTGSTWEIELARVTVAAAATSISGSAVVNRRYDRTELVRIEVVLGTLTNGVEIPIGGQFQRSGATALQSEGDAAGGHFYTSTVATINDFSHIISTHPVVNAVYNPKLRWIGRWPTGAANTNVRGIGFSTMASLYYTIATAVSDMAVLYNVGQGSWIFKTADGTAATSTTISARDTGVHEWAIRTRDAGVTWECLRDGVVVATHTTNLPRTSQYLYSNQFVANNAAAADFGPVGYFYQVTQDRELT